MKIIEVYLKNVKSYAESTVQFREGVNFISGVNGAGKTTIIESIGFALFNYLPYSAKEFVREGENQAEIQVLFEANDERLYRVKRKFSKQQKTVKWEAYDEENGAFLSELHGLQDMENWIKPLLGLDPDANLADTFREIVAVDQGLFTAPFLSTETNRRTMFDKILKVEGYREAFKNSSVVEKVFENDIRGIEGELSGLGDQLERLPIVEEQLLEKQQQAQNIEEQLGMKSKLLDSTEATLKQLEDLYKEKERMEQSATNTEDRIKSVEVQMALYQQEIQLGEEAARQVALASEGYNRYVENERKLRALDEQKTIKDELLQNKQREENRMTAERSAIESDDRSWQERSVELRDRKIERTVALKQLAQLEQDMTSQRLKVKHWIDRSSHYENNFDPCAGTLQQWDHSFRQAEELIARVLDYSSSISRSTEALSSFATLQEKLNRLPDLDSLMADAKQNLGRVEAREEQLQQNREHLLQGKCPIIEEACPSEKVAGDLTGYFEQTLETVVQRKHDEMERVLQLQVQIEERRSLQQKLQQLEPVQVQRSEAVQWRSRVLDELKALLANVQSESLQHAFSDYEIKLSSYLSELEPAQVELKLTAMWKRLIESQWFSDLTCNLNELNALLLTNDTKENAIEESSLSNWTDSLNAYVRKVRGLLQNGTTIPKTLHTAWKTSHDSLLELYHRADSELQSIQYRKSEFIKQEDQDRLLSNELEKRAHTLEERRRNLQEQLERIKLLSERLIPLETVEQTMGQVKLSLENDLESYRTYTQNQKTIERLPEYKRQLEQAVQSKQTLINQLHNIKSNLMEIAKEYSDDKHLEVKSHYQSLRDEVTSLRVQSRNTDLELQRLKEEFARLIAVKSKIEDRLKAKRLKEKSLKWTRLIRKVINDAGDPIAQVFRHHLSQQANLLHRQISNENVQLQWGEGYELKIIDNHRGKERERIFKQLSGGEQMTAALAIRLSLLRYLSDVKMGFFDEPTTNLDVHRRQSLVQAIQNGTEGFDQLFVISHDDAFEALTENTVYLQKDQGLGARVGAL
jgi:exonuclease SbcC